MEKHRDREKEKTGRLVLKISAASLSDQEVPHRQMHTDLRS